MNRLLLLSFFTLFIFSHFSSFAQEESMVKCTMTVEEILNHQPFDIDDAKSEDARNISILLFEEFQAIYELVETDLASEIEAHKKAINAAIVAAKEIEMNYTMFKEDLEFIESLK